MLPLCQILETSVGSLYCEELTLLNSSSVSPQPPNWPHLSICYTRTLNLNRDMTLMRSHLFLLNAQSAVDRGTPKLPIMKQENALSLQRVH